MSLEQETLLGIFLLFGTNFTFQSNNYENNSAMAFHPKEFYHFHAVDYVVFGAMLLLSALTGMYFGCKNRYCKNQEAQTLSEYLTGSGNMKTFPVAMSLVASYISGVTILGTPAEIYNFGFHYVLIMIAISVSGAIVATVYLPVFTKLQVFSSYEYLELRFNSSVRTIASVCFVLDEIMFLPILIYVPSLAFSQVTGTNLHIVGTIVCIVCVFYTVLGGLKAVVYTDTWQILTMFLSVVVIVILGVIAIGGPSVIYNESLKGGRMDVSNFSPSMTDRYTVWGVLIGGFFYWTSFNAVNQTMVQRYLSLPTTRKSQRSVVMFIIGVVIFVGMCCFSGILVYATYSKCDPLTSGRIASGDQLLPLYVMETVGHLRGVPGLFIAGVFGAALSSLSVVLNSTSVVFLEDFLKGCIGLKLTERTAKIICRSVVLILGVVAVAFLFIVEHMGGVLSVATALSSIAAGTTFGVFTLGMLFPWANTKGAIAGGISGALFSGLVSFGTQGVIAAKMVVPRKLPVSVEGCYEKYGISVNATIIDYPDESGIFPLFRLSYLWVTPIGALTVVIVGVIVSFLVGKTNLETLDPDLISPACQWLMPEESKRFAGSALRRVRHKHVVEGDGTLTNLNRPNLNVSIPKSNRFPLMNATPLLFGHQEADAENNDGADRR